MKLVDLPIATPSTVSACNESHAANNSTQTLPLTEVRNASSLVLQSYKAGTLSSASLLALISSARNNEEPIATISDNAVLFFVSNQIDPQGSDPCQKSEISANQVMPRPLYEDFFLDAKKKIETMYSFKEIVTQSVDLALLYIKKIKMIDGQIHAYKNQQSFNALDGQNNNHAPHKNAVSNQAGKRPHTLKATAEKELITCLENKRYEFLLTAKAFFSLALLQQKEAHQAGDSAEKTVFQAWKWIQDGHYNLPTSKDSSIESSTSLSWTAPSRYAQKKLENPQATEAVRMAELATIEAVKKLEQEMEISLARIPKADREDILGYRDFSDVEELYASQNMPADNELMTDMHDKIIQKVIEDLLVRSKLPTGSNKAIPEIMPTQVTRTTSMPNRYQSEEILFFSPKIKSASSPDLQINSLQLSFSSLAAALPKLVQKAISDGALHLASKGEEFVTQFDQSVSLRSTPTMGDMAASARQVFHATIGASPKIATVHNELMREKFFEREITPENIATLVERENNIALTEQSNNFPDKVAKIFTPMRAPVAQLSGAAVIVSSNPYGDTPIHHEHRVDVSTPF